MPLVDCGYPHAKFAYIHRRRHVSDAVHFLLYRLSEGCSAPVVPGCKVLSNYSLQFFFFLLHFTIVFVHVHLQIFTDRAARREISEVEVLCDYCEWTGKEKYLQVMF